MSDKYFNKLNYTMANEDTTYEVGLVAKNAFKNILAVGGSGSRCLPFLAMNLESLTVVDVSKEQLLLIRLKLETIKQLSREEAIEFWTTENTNRRSEIATKLALETEISTFLSYMMKEDTPLLYQGSWEKTFIKFSKLTQFLLSHKTLKELFEAKNSYEYYIKYIKGFRWNAIIKIVGNKAMFNSLLYKGNFIQKNSELSYYDYYYRAFDRLFALDIKRSHFMQICFFGKVIYDEGLPIEFSSELFDKIKTSKTKVKYLQGSIFDQNYEDKFDFVSLSDVPSYLSGQIEEQYIQKLKPFLISNAHVVNRFYLRKTENTDETSFVDVSGDYKQEASKELVQMYDIQVLRLQL